MMDLDGKIWIMIYKKPYIICAAIWFNDGVKRENLPRNIKEGFVAAGWRHGNCFTCLYTHYPERDYILKNKDRKVTIQGFLTSTGNFVDRVVAGKIAFECGQVTKPNDFFI